MVLPPLPEVAGPVYGAGTKTVVVVTSIETVTEHVPWLGRTVVRPPLGLVRVFVGLVGWFGAKTALNWTLLPQVKKN